MEQSELIVDKLVESIRRVNQKLLEVSNQTIMNLPEINRATDSYKSGWLKEDALITSFVQEFNNLPSNNVRSEQNISSLVEELNERRELIKSELQKLLQEQSLLETAISNSIRNLSDLPKSNESLTFY